MGENSLMGAVKQAAGSVQEKFGEAVGSSEQEAKGAALHDKGTVQRTVGNVQDKATDTLRDVADKVNK